MSLPEDLSRDDIRVLLENVGRVAADAHDTYTLVEHVERKGLPPTATNRQIAVMAMALDQEHSQYADETPVTYLSTLHYVTGLTHAELILRMRRWAREQMRFLPDPLPDELFVTALGDGFARKRPEDRDLDREKWKSIHTAASRHPAHLRPEPLRTSQPPRQSHLRIVKP